MTSVVVLGGGISGLSTAYYLATFGKGLFNKITLVEGSSRLGGWIKSTRRANGCIHEHGTRSIRPLGVPGRNTLALFDELGLSDQLVAVTRSQPAAKRRYLYVKGKLHMLAIDPISLLVKSGPFSRPLAFLALRDLTRKSEKKEDESVHEFFTRRFGNEVADIVADSMCRGICAGDAKKISIKGLFRNIFEAEQKHGSVIKGLFKETYLDIKMKPGVKAYESESVNKSQKLAWATVSLKLGLEQLPERIVERLSEEGVEIITNNPISKLNFRDELVHIELKGQKNILANHIFSALPAKALSISLPQQHSLLTSLLSSISSVSVAVVNLEYSGKLLPVQGFGYLVPSMETSKVLGVVFDSCTFPEHNGQEDVTRLSVMLGGEWFEQLFGNALNVKNEEISSIAIEEVKRVLQIDQTPQWQQTIINENSIPQYYLGHGKRVEDIEAYVKTHSLPLSLVGASYHGVAVNDCIYNARQTVLKYLDNVRYHPNIVK